MERGLGSDWGSNLSLPVWRERGRGGGGEVRGCNVIGSGEGECGRVRWPKVEEGKTQF